MKAEIVKCGAEDLEAIRAVGIDTYEETFGAHNPQEIMRAYIETAFAPEKLAAELAEPQSEFFLVFAEGEAAGYLKVNTGTAQTEKMGKDAMEVERIYIRSKFKGRGLGRQLMDLAVKLAGERGKTRLWLGVWEHNPDAIRFYEKSGFVQTGSHSFFMGTDEQRDLVMTKRL
ncbi:GNAT family N-acetyltransferase [Bhargavaea ullalensis]|uniref:Ribosomal protein S18 acetylase RimI-like enzyme n=1 Tax=Bhargavaea ullalensis TaxID=1265685 RepID=A0ABV2G8B7_9BACL